MYRPKVGEECMVATTDHDFMKCKIVAYDDLDVIYRPENRSLYSDETNRCQFRPLKSKRDEEIEEMCSDAICTNSPITKTICEHLHSKGYRKQLPYSQFVSIIQCYLNEFAEWDDSSALSEAYNLAARLNRTPEDTL